MQFSLKSKWMYQNSLTLSNHRWLKLSGSSYCPVVISSTAGRRRIEEVVVHKDRKQGLQWMLGGNKWLAGVNVSRWFHSNALLLGQQHSWAVIPFLSFARIPVANVFHNGVWIQCNDFQRFASGDNCRIYVLYTYDMKMVVNNSTAPFQLHSNLQAFLGPAKDYSQRY